MIKHLLVSFFFFFLSAFCFGQNLVPNPSFEEYDSCPDFASQISRATGWYSARATPDYFNLCATGFNWCTVPLNYFGYRTPASGNAYAGIIARLGYSDGPEESIGVQLLTPLQVGKKYYASFKVSLGGQANPLNYCGTDKLGILFSSNKFNTTFPVSVCSNCAQIYSNSIITDTLNWTKIIGSFVADSAYSFLNVGRFNYNILTDSTQLAGNACNAYYYIDDVCLSEDSNYAYSYTYSELHDLHRADIAITCFPNPFNDLLAIASNNTSLEKINICDLTGKILKTYIAGNSHKYLIGLSDLPKGAYIASVFLENSSTSNQIIVKI